MSSGRSRKRSKIAGGARKVGLKPVKPTAGLKPVKKTPATPTTPRYVSEIRNILALLMKNKASMPFKQVPAAPDYRSLLKDALCLNVMQAKAARNPCGYSNFKEFDNDMKLLHRQEMKYDNKVSSALSAKRKSRMEILKGYYDTLSRSYLAHGPNLSPNAKTTSSTGGGNANTSKSTSTTTTTTSVTTVSSTTSTTSTNANSGSTQAPPGSVKKIKATKTTMNAATRKKSGKDGVINLTDDSPPVQAPVATKKVTLAGRKRTLSNQMKEETKEDKPPQKKIRLSENKSAVKTKTTVTSNVTKTKTKAKAKTKKIEESKHIEIDEPLTQPPSQPSQTSTQEEDVKMVEVMSTKTKIQSSFGSGALSTPVSRAGFSFGTPTPMKSLKAKSTKKKTSTNVPATFLEMASAYAMVSGGKNGSGSASTGKTKSSTTTTTTTTTVTTSSSSSSSSARTTSLLSSIKKNTKEPTSSFSTKFSFDSGKTRNEKKPGTSRILKDTVVETKRGKEEMDVDAISDSDLPPRFQGGYGGSRYESAMRMVSRGEFSFDNAPYTTPKTTIRSYTFSDDDGEDVNGASNMRSSFTSRFTSSSGVGSSSLLSSTNNLTGRSRMREYMFDDDDVEMESTDQSKWSRYELTIEVQSPVNQRWKRRTVERDGSDIQKVVQRYFDMNSHETMRVVGARFLRPLSDF